jgi:hypothetical protein
MPNSGWNVPLWRRRDELWHEEVVIATRVEGGTQLGLLIIWSGHNVGGVVVWPWGPYPPIPVS